MMARNRYRQLLDWSRFQGIPVLENKAPEHSHRGKNKIGSESRYHPASNNCIHMDSIQDLSNKKNSFKHVRLKSDGNCMIQSKFKAKKDKAANDQRNDSSIEIEMGEEEIKKMEDDCRHKSIGLKKQKGYGKFDEK